MLGIFRGIRDSNIFQNRIIFCHGCVYFGRRLFEQGMAVAAAAAAAAAATALLLVHCCAHEDDAAAGV